MDRQYTVTLPKPHTKQLEFINSKAKRKVVRAGRRSGKTVGIAIFAVQKFLEGRRVLYAAPTSEQIGRFWSTVTQALFGLINDKIYVKNETEHTIDNKGTENRLRAKTCWDADTLRGDYCDLLIFDEWQQSNEDAWALVGAPMLVDNNGDAVFVFTPPSLHSRSSSKANDPQHAAKLFRKYKELSHSRPDRYATYHFTSMDNPYISQEALAEITNDMSSVGYRQEILAEDIDESPGALWTRDVIEKHRVLSVGQLDRIVVAIDPSATSDGDEAGIIAVGKAKKHGYVLSDKSVQGSPLKWATAAIDLYRELKADCIVAESNNGGEMISTIICGLDSKIKVKLVSASRGKQTRAEPCAAKYEQGCVHHVGSFAALEDEMALWVPGDKSPNRMDALVWGCTELKLEGSGGTDWLKVVS